MESFFFFLTKQEFNCSSKKNCTSQKLFICKSVYILDLSQYIYITFLCRRCTLPTKANEIMLDYLLCHLPTYASADGLNAKQFLLMFKNVSPHGSYWSQPLRSLSTVETAWVEAESQLSDWLSRVQYELNCNILPHNQ